MERGFPSADQPNFVQSHFGSFSGISVFVAFNYGLYVHHVHTLCFSVGLSFVGIPDCGQSEGLFSQCFFGIPDCGQSEGLFSQFSLCIPDCGQSEGLFSQCFAMVVGDLCVNCLSIIFKPEVLSPSDDWVPRGASGR